MALFWFYLLTIATCLWTQVTGLQNYLQPRQGNPNNVWITVDSSGSAKTITPSVESSDGITKTLSGAPGYVTKTAVYTLTTAAGLIQTSTGMSPVATAKDSSGSGAFIECSNYQGSYSPICLPRMGAVLEPGATYYVTWDPSYFSPKITRGALKVEYDDNIAFITIGNITTQSGFYAWTIDEDILIQHGRNASSDLGATLYLFSSFDNGDVSGDELGVDVAEGPNITISRTAPSYDNSKADSSGDLSYKTKVAIGVSIPVAIIVVLLVLGGIAFRKKRAGLGSRMTTSKGRQPEYANTDQRHMGDKVPAMHLIEFGSGASTQKSPTNVFQDEIRRQEAQRRL